MRQAVMSAAVVLTLAMCTAPLYGAKPSLHFITEHNPPGQYLDATGKVSGVTVELLRHIARRQHQQVEFSLLPWARAYDLALQGENRVLFETVRTPEREPYFQWVGPVKLFDMRLYASEAVQASRIAVTELHQNFRACSYRGAAQIRYFLALGFKEGKNLTLTAQAGDCLKMLMKGRTDLIALNYYRYGDGLSEHGVTVRVIAPLYFSELFLAFSPTIPSQMVQRWQQALTDSYKDGTMRRLYSGHYPEAMISSLEKTAKAPL